MVAGIYIATAVENFNYLTAHNPVMTSVPTIQTRVSFSHRLLFSCPGQDKYCLDISASGARSIIVRVISSEILSGSVARWIRWIGGLQS